MTCRFLLALYETNAILERGGSSVSSHSVNLSRAGQEGSPELPEFLNPLAGLIHSFPDGDPDLFEDMPEQETEGEAEADEGMDAEVIEMVMVGQADIQAEASSSGQGGKVGEQV